jgi:hypothetical protein
MKITVAQYFTDNLRYGQYTEKINRLFCEKHGYDYYLEKNSFLIRTESEDRDITWFKPKFLQKVFEKTNADYILFLDADAVFCDHDNYKIENYIIPDKDIVVTEDHGPSKINAGVFLLKNTSFTHEILQRWWDYGYRRPDLKRALWHDQTCFGLLMDELGTVADEKIKIISNRTLNWREPFDNCFVFHAFAYGNLPNRRIDSVYARFFENEFTFETLQELAIRYPTDKNWLHNYYNRIYDSVLTPLRESTKRICEIGIDKGDSLRSMKAFFKNAEIYGYDVNTSLFFNEDRIHTSYLDQSDRSSLQSLIDSHAGNEFDIVIDDGSHRMYDQQITLAMLFKHVKRGGIFICEDLHTSLEAKMESKKVFQWNTIKPTNVTTLDMLLCYNSTGKILSDAITDEEANYLAANIKEIRITNDNPESITSVIYKK